jgi:hypothetical protein
MEGFIGIIGFIIMLAWMAGVYSNLKKAKIYALMQTKLLQKIVEKEGETIDLEALFKESETESRKW